MTVAAIRCVLRPLLRGCLAVGSNFLRSTKYAVCQNKQAQLRVADVNRIAETVPRSNNPSVDWGKRDLQFVNQVQRAILAIRARRPKGRISVADVFCLVPDLKAKYRRIGDLPRTRSLLSQACMHSPRDSGDSNLL